MSEQIHYYVKAPNGRFKLVPTPKSDTAAIEAFKRHWTANVNWTCDGKRVLVKEVKQEIMVEPISKFKKEVA